jgi:cysteine desulfuration protein SufE
LPDRFKEERDKMEEVPECMTPVCLFAEKQADGGIAFHFDIPPQSPTVRGLTSILASGLNGAKLEEIISVPTDFFLPMKLDEAVSQQRIHGFMGVLAHMKQAAVKADSK